MSTHRHQSAFTAPPCRRTQPAATPCGLRCGIPARPSVFFGSRVPLTADHGRCWMGHLLTEEVKAGRLLAAELLVPCRESVAVLLAQAQGMQPHGPPPSWLWSTWPAAGGSAGGSAVTMTMSFSPHDGVAIRLSSEDNSAQAHVFRVLRQYCDVCEGRDWRPIPESPKVLSKATGGLKITAPEALKLFVAGSPRLRQEESLPARHYLDGGDSVRLRVVQALSRAMSAAHSTGNVYDHLVCLREVDSAFHAAIQGRVALRQEWVRTASQALDQLIRRLLDEKEDSEERGRLDEARELALKFTHDFDAPAPASLPEAERALASAASVAWRPPPRGEALLLLSKMTSAAAAPVGASAR
mmetsp:Transcript_102932/g.331737  ORF Transcript_102932/g.331737 Transcript_102932/m.331737 type:complete len:355 (-) Transcript_102932:32-1096(-)